MIDVSTMPEEAIVIASETNARYLPDHFNKKLLPSIIDCYRLYCINAIERQFISRIVEKFYQRTQPSLERSKMSLLNRRELLKLSATAATGITLFPGSFALAGSPATADATPAHAAPSADRQVPISDKYITCFYQINRAALEAFTENQRLPNGPDYLHIMSHSAPRSEGFLGRGKNTACLWRKLQMGARIRSG